MFSLVRDLPSSPTVTFAGYSVGREGVAADPKKVEAITAFPTPKCISDLRSFMGLANQLGSFSKDIAAHAAPLRDLLQRRNQFLWENVHQRAFQNVKTALASTPVLAPFRPGAKLCLHVDASRLHGLGYVLRQEKEQDQPHEHAEWSLITCGSRFISDVESRSPCQS